MRILIVGAAGMLGRDVCGAAAAAGHEPIALARDELDICDRDAVGVAVSSAASGVVVNCAAWTDVDGAETNAGDAMEVNGQGAGNVAAAAASVGAWTVHVSSDYVFDGLKGAAYVESDAVGPVSVYGRSKLAGERAVVAAAGDAHTIVRSSWLFGAGGKCFPKTILRLAGEREELSVVSDQVGCPTYTGHLAGALVALASRPVSGVLHVAGGGQCSWCEFAQEIVSSAGLACVVAPISSQEYPQPARRPANSVLVSERDAPVLPGWRVGLSAFMAEIARAAV